VKAGGNDPNDLEMFEKLEDSRRKEKQHKAAIRGEQYIAEQKVKAGGNDPNDLNMVDKLQNTRQKARDYKRRQREQKEVDDTK
jgi:hypothetical protein